MVGCIEVVHNGLDVQWGWDLGSPLQFVSFNENLNEFKLNIYLKWMHVNVAV